MHAEKPPAAVQGSSRDPVADSLSAGSALDASTAFAMQYTSLILIVLCVTVGTLLKPGAPFAKPASEVLSAELTNSQGMTAETEAARAKPEPEYFGVIEYERLFDHAHQVDEARGSAIVSVLLNHDVDAVITIVVGPGDSALFEALERSVGISKFLVQRKVPASAFRVRVVPEPHANLETRVFFTHSREAQS